LALIAINPKVKKSIGKKYRCSDGPFVGKYLYLTTDETFTFTVGSDGKVGKYVVVHYNQSAKWCEQEIR